MELDTAIITISFSFHIHSMDQQYGPMTHLFEVSGLSNNIQDWAVRSVVSFLSSSSEMIVCCHNPFAE